METVALYAGTIYTPKDEFCDGVIVIEKGVITKAGPRRRVPVPRGAKTVDCSNRIVAPGFVDVHTHGGAGHDLMEADESALSAVGRFFAAHGTTSYLATTMTAGLPRTLAATEGLTRWIHQAAKRNNYSWNFGARPLGIHFEGPFLSKVRCGAQPKKDIRKPSAREFGSFLEIAGRAARVITLAPEVEGGLDLLKFARRRGVRVSIGHSDATFEQAERAIAAGASHGTHVYNAMRPFSHRDPGIVGAVLTNDRVSAELICDGVHVLPAAVELLARAKGLERVILITDSISAAGMPDGRYRLGEIMVWVKDGICRIDSKNLAGSTLTLDRALRNFAAFTGRNFAECLPCATLNPARIIGLEGRKGIIEPGADADLVVLDKKYNVKQTYVAGRRVF